MPGPRPRPLDDLEECEQPPFTPQIIEWVRFTVAELPSDKHILTQVFYQELFQLAPQSRGLFPTDMTPQEDRLLGALLGVAQALDRPAMIEDHLRRWGVVHRRMHGIDDELYIYVGQALVRTITRLLTNVDSLIHSSWVAVYQWMAAVMIDAANQADRIDADPSLLLREVPAQPAPQPAIATVTPIRARPAPARPRRAFGG